MTALILFLMLTVAASAIAVAISGYRKVGPNRVLVVSGRRGHFLDPSTGEAHQKSFRIYHGGGTFVLPLFERVDVMSVELMTLELRTPEFFTKYGVPIVVDAIAQIKVRSDDPLAVATAAEMFLGKSASEMNEIAHQMMQGHLRGVISTLPFEEIHQSPEAFAQSVQRLTAADLAHMGIEVVSFTIREVRDPSGYLQALGRPQLAAVQKNAIVGEAQAERDAKMGRAEAEREAAVTAARATEASRLAQIASEVEVARAQADKDAHVHALASRIAEARAQAELAYDVAQVRARQEIVKETLQLEELNVKRRELELAAEIERPAAAERARKLMEAEADAETTRLRAQAEADGIRARGAAEAESLRAKLAAEAEGMSRKAQAWQQYGSAALGQLWIEKLPEIAAAVAAPLSRIDRIVLVGQGEGGTGIDKITRGVTEVVAQLPALAETLRGIDVAGLIDALPGKDKRAA